MILFMQTYVIVTYIEHVYMYITILNSKYGCIKNETEQLSCC